MAQNSNQNPPIPPAIPGNAAPALERNDPGDSMRHRGTEIASPRGEPGPNPAVPAARPLDHLAPNITPQRATHSGVKPRR